jgi:signal transduction histidine kinase
MKIVSKAYLLIAILISVAGFNLFLLYQEDQTQSSESYSIIRVGEIKVKAESISSSAASAVGEDFSELSTLEKEIEEVKSILRILKTGGIYNEQPHETLPSSMNDHYDHVLETWEDFELSVGNVVTTSRFDPDAIRTSEYLLEKNQEMILLTNQIPKDLQNLDRNYNTHKQIADDLVDCAKVIGEQVLLIRTGGGFTSKQTLEQKQLEFEIGIRKLSQIPTSDLDVESVGKTHDMLEPIPRENSETLRQLVPLWESVSLRIDEVEESGILSKEHTTARNVMNDQKKTLFFHMDHLIENWNVEIASRGSEQQTAIQILLIVDIGVFFLVLFLIRQSLSPLVSITDAISRVKEGVYGEKIEYKGTDEVGQLVDSFNIMSKTIKEKEEVAKKTDIAKDEFLAMITHELKTPLVPIQGYSDILLNEHLGKLNDKQKERISIIKSSSEALLSIISDLLDAQKLDLDQLRMKKEKTDIKNTITKAIETLKPEAESNNIKITSNATSVIINHDPERIGQVITNLIKNSIIAIQPNPGKIEVLMYDLPKNVKISIKDNGVGIPQDKQDELFKKFYQVDASLTRERGGSGLGLAICKGIIDNHLGEISVESSPNQGATFSFTIPKEDVENTKSALNFA